jgi:hypothetical protein
MKCSVCGAKMDKGAAKCPACGRPAAAPEAQVSLGGKTAGPRSRRAPAPARRPGIPSRGTRAKSEPFNKKYILIAAVAIAVAGLVFYLVYSGREIGKYSHYFVILIPVVISIVQNVFNRYAAGAGYVKNMEKLRLDCEPVLRKVLQSDESAVFTAMSVVHRSMSLIIITTDRVIIIGKVERLKGGPQFAVQAARLSEIAKIARNQLVGATVIEFRNGEKINLMIPAGDAAKEFVSAVGSRMTRRPPGAGGVEARPLRGLCVECGAETEGGSSFCPNHSGKKRKD